jgi:hypothetical protein
LFVQVYVDVLDYKFTIMQSVYEFGYFIQLLFLAFFKI